MIKPTVGRVVWFRNQGILKALSDFNDAQPMTAQVTYVHSDTLVNVAGFDHAGNHFRHTSITLRQEGESVPMGQCYVEWMPYQVGQAKKHEPESPAPQ